MSAQARANAGQTAGGGPCIGLALGSGSARGWAHIGVINALARAGIEPHVVAGTSVGAVVGAFHVTGNLAALEEWVRRLTRRDMVMQMDLTVTGGGGFMEGRRLAAFYARYFGDRQVEATDVPFTAVATDLQRGTEVWLRRGPLLDAVRASSALPGIFTPVRHGDRWLVDGGLVNPVPVSVCRVMGADVVIAVNLNGDILGRHLRRGQPLGAGLARATLRDARWLERLPDGFRERAALLLGQLRSTSDDSPRPGLFEVIASAINIMQDRVTRSRMAGDPPDVIVAPRLGEIGLLEYDRGEEGIRSGEEAVERLLPEIRELL